MKSVSLKLKYIKVLNAVEEPHAHCQAWLEGGGKRLKTKVFKVWIAELDDKAVVSKHR